MDVDPAVVVDIIAVIYIYIYILLLLLFFFCFAVNSVCCFSESTVLDGRFCE